MQTLFTRNGALLWVGFVLAILGYLKTVGTSPVEWNYDEWLNALTFIAAWVIGKLQSSPLPSKGEVEFLQQGGVDRRK